MTTAHADPATTNTQESSPRYAGWRVVLACYLAAVFCWGFGLYGHGVYLTELHHLHGWPTALISGAVTSFYLLTAALTNVVGLWFDGQRGLALSLALNGASSGGILVTPVLVLAIAHYGFANAVIGSSIVIAVILLPAIAL